MILQAAFELLAAVRHGELPTFVVVHEATRGRPGTAFLAHDKRCALDM